MAISLCSLWMESIWQVCEQLKNMESNEHLARVKLTTWVNLRSSKAFHYEKITFPDLDTLYPKIIWGTKNLMMILLLFGLL